MKPDCDVCGNPPEKHIIPMPGLRLSVCEECNAVLRRAIRWGASKAGRRAR